MGSPFSGLDFGFLYVKDLSDKDSSSSMQAIGQVASEDNLPCLNFWMLQDEEKADLLKLVLRPENLEYTSAIIVLDFDQPWEMMNALNRWMSLLAEPVLGALRQLPISKQDEIKKRIAMHINNYERFANGEQKEGEENPKIEKKSKNPKGDDSAQSGSENNESEEDDFEDLRSMLPLPEGVLKVNLGIPITVVCHKVDLIGRGDKAQSLEQNIDFI